MRKVKRVGFVIKPHAPDVKKALEELIRYFSLFLLRWTWLLFWGETELY